MKRLFPVLILLGAIAFFSMSAMAADVTLGWDPNTETDMAGYKVYFGSSSRTYGTAINIGLVTTYTVPNLSPGKWYFAVTAFNTSGAESGYSNEVSAIIPTPTPLEPLNLKGPLTVNVTRYGATIAWTTGDVATDGVIEYGLTASALDKSLTIPGGRSTDHIGYLTGLKTKTTYYYRVVSKDENGVEVRSDTGSFVTK